MEIDYKFPSDAQIQQMLLYFFQ